MTEIVSVYALQRQPGSARFEDLMYQGSRLESPERIERSSRIVSEPPQTHLLRYMQDRHWELRRRDPSFATDSAEVAS